MVELRQCNYCLIKRELNNQPYFGMQLPDNQPNHGQFDIFMDRLIYINHDGNYDRNETHDRGEYEHDINDLSVSITGIILSDQLVLTSFNPFRQITKFKFKRHYTCVCYIYTRKYDQRKDTPAIYNWKSRNIACARQVIPASDSSSPLNMWFGYRGAGAAAERMHSPIHDLMVIRVEHKFKGVMLESKHTKAQFLATGDNWLELGPIQTEVASAMDILGRDLRFAMMGHIIHSDVQVRKKVRVYEVDPEENVAVNCDEWLPREWGLFICLQNVYGIRQLASGAMLFSHKKLFGVGSFTLYKGNQSVLVFTDVRKYSHLLNKTCTGEEQEMMIV
ncbi:Hemocytin [Operophtera brumata]|uniref:Hemocytin n=1 Tax=Operophtera brumata TaxID=104452 RepID=A0A0L7LD45_OPEBR|nr:Hemocytin [Operophtera brumata]